MKIRRAVRFVLPLGSVALLGLSGCVTTTFPNFSHWDHLPPIDSLPSDRAPAVIHRSSRGLEPDEAYRTRAMQARKRRDLLWGAYHFCDGTSVDRQLGFALERVGYAPGGRFETLMVFDFEKNITGTRTHMSIAQLADLIRKFHARTGVLPVIYVNPGWFNGKLERDRYTKADLAVIRQCPLWTSSYESKPTRARVFEPWTFWQYAGDSTLGSYGDLVSDEAFPRGIPGVGPKLEMNLFRGDVLKLRGFWKRHSIPTRF